MLQHLVRTSRCGCLDYWMVCYSLPFKLPETLPQIEPKCDQQCVCDEIALKQNDIVFSQSLPTNIGLNLTIHP